MLFLVVIRLYFTLGIYDHASRKARVLPASIDSCTHQRIAKKIDIYLKLIFSIKPHQARKSAKTHVNETMQMQ